MAFADRQVPFHVSGIFEDSGDVGYGHYDYINRIGSMFGKDKVLKYHASSGNARDDELLAARIEGEFAHDFPTVDAATSTTAQNAWARFGKVQQLLAFVMAAILLCATSVMASVLAHTVAQRRAKLALLQVLGFRRVSLFCAFLLEVAAIVVIGALLGLGVGWLVVNAMPTSMRVAIGGFAIPAWAYWWTPFWLAGVAIIALALPSAFIARLRPTDFRAI